MSKNNQWIIDVKESDKKLSEVLPRLQRYEEATGDPKLSVKNGMVTVLAQFPTIKTPVAIEGRECKLNLFYSASNDIFILYETFLQELIDFRVPDALVEQDDLFVLKETDDGNFRVATMFKTAEDYVNGKAVLMTAVNTILS
jgi:hypothetical protein